MTTLQRLELYKYSAPRYENFIAFVERYGAPHMGMRFVREEYYRTLWDDMWKCQFIDAQLSRGHSKSEIFGVWVTAYIAVTQPFNPFYEKVWGRKKRMTEQLVASSDATATGELLGRIARFLENADEFAHLIPTAKEGRWNTEKLELTNGSVIYARSIKMKRGLHVDRIVCDDLTTEASTLSDDETWDFLSGAVLPMGTAKQAMVQIDGTPIRATDVMGRLSRDPNWHHIKLPAILNHETKTLLSPNRFTWDTLMAVKSRIGSVKFEAEYMLNPIDDTVSLIKREWVRACFNIGQPIMRHRSYFDEVYLGVDFAFSDRKEADHSVFFILGTHEGKFYMLDYIRRQGMSGQEQLQYIRELHTTYRFDLIGLEENSIKAIIPEVRALNLPIKLFRMGTVDEQDKKKPDFSSVISVSKRNLVIRIGTTFENGALVIPYKGDDAVQKADRLLNECISWAQEDGKLIELGEHPDVPVALGFALEAAGRSSFVFEMGARDIY